ncbi:MAG: circularly permuted type 2 ATP-grasp protein [Lacunisphaera sp.]
MPAPVTSARSVLHGYAPKGSRFDECVDAAGHLRPAWQQFFNLLSGPPTAALQAATEASHRAIIEQDVSMNVYRGERAGSQLWPMDVLPLLIGAGEWTALTRGLRQRAHLFNELLLDLYGEQKLLRGGLLPAALAMHNPHFLRPCTGLGRGSPVFLHTLAVDVARSLDAPLVGDRGPPRCAVRPRLLAAEPHHHAPGAARRFPPRAGAAPPSVFPRLPRIPGTPRPAARGRAHRPAFPRRRQRNLFRTGLPLELPRLHAGRGRGPHHAQPQGLPSAPSGGLQQVDVVLRRLDSDYCDPLETRPELAARRARLINAAHSGNVALSNLPGSRALETPALLGFLQPLCRTSSARNCSCPTPPRGGAARTRRATTCWITWPNSW